MTLKNNLYINKIEETISIRYRNKILYTAA